MLLPAALLFSEGRTSWASPIPTEGAFFAQTCAVTGRLGPMPEMDADVIRHALSTAREHGFRQVRLKAGDATFRATLDEWSEEDMLSSEAPAEQGPPPPVEVTAPLVGYFRELPEPLASGARVKVGQVVGQIVALGLANDVVAKAAGEVIEVLVAAGEPVEYGQPIARLRRDA